MDRHAQDLTGRAVHEDHGRPQAGRVEAQLDATGLEQHTHHHHARATHDPGKESWPQLQGHTVVFSSLEIGRRSRAD